MSKSYVIQWKSTSNGRTGRGTKRFEQEAAELLAEELNREYPEIVHEVVEIGSESEPPLSETGGPRAPEPLLETHAEAGVESPRLAQIPESALAFR